MVVAQSIGCYVTSYPRMGQSAFPGTHSIVAHLVDANALVHIPHLHSSGLAIIINQLTTHTYQIVLIAFTNSRDSRHTFCDLSHLPLLTHNTNHNRMNDQYVKLVGSSWYNTRYEYMLVKNQMGLVGFDETGWVICTNAFKWNCVHLSTE